MSRQLSKEDQTNKYYLLGTKAINSIKFHNDTSLILFNHISKLSELLPTTLNNMSRLSDMITDAIVVAGRSSLSKSTAELKHEYNGVLYNKETTEITLDYSVQQEIPVKQSKSYIITDSSYNIFDTTTNNISNFQSFLQGSKIRLENTSNNYRYTFSIEFPTYLNVNNLILKLGKETDSYPLLSELYYISKDNRKEYITILNTFDTKLNLDDYRVKENEYNIMFNTVNTNRIYITLEDIDKESLILEKLQFRKLEYVASGYIILGPIISSYPILKVALEAKGNIEGARFAVSYNKEDWIEIVLPSELTKDVSKSKIVAFNTVNEKSLKLAEDVKELYVRVELNQLNVTDSIESKLTRGMNMTVNPSSYIGDDKPIAVSVYKEIPEVFYGDTSYVTQPRTTELNDKNLSHIITQGKYKVRGFISSDMSFTNEDILTNIYTSSSYLKVSGNIVDTTTFEPTTSKIYGYAITKSKRTVNTTSDSNLVLVLNKEYNKGIYTVRQNNKELKIDLSTGFVKSVLETILIVDKDKVTELYDEAGRKLKELKVEEFNDICYISLISNNIIDIPEIETPLVFNHIYPLRLNETNEYSLLESKIVCIDQLVTFTSIYSLLLEEIQTSVVVSKENGNIVVLSDNLLKERYTEDVKETIPAFLGTRAIKLNNKHIQKGSFKVMYG